MYCASHVLFSSRHAPLPLLAHRSPSLYIFKSWRSSHRLGCRWSLWSRVINGQRAFALTALWRSLSAALWPFGEFRCGKNTLFFSSSHALQTAAPVWSRRGAAPEGATQKPSPTQYITPVSHNASRQRRAEISEMQTCFFNTALLRLQGVL